MKKAKTPLKHYYVPRNIQLVVTGLVVSLFILTSLQSLYSAIMQYMANPNVGGLYSYLAATLLLPVIFFGAAYALNPRPLARLSRCFESLLLTIAGVVSWMLAVQFIYLLLPINLSSNAVAAAGHNELFLASSVAVVYVGLLIYLRQSKHWK